IPKLKDDARTHLLKMTAAEDREGMLLTRINRRSYAGLSLSSLAAEIGWQAEAIRKELAGLLASGAVVEVGTRFVSASAVSAFKTLCVSTLEKFHAQNSLSPGMKQESLREKFHLDSEIFPALLALLAAEGTIDLLGDSVQLRGRGVVMKDEEAKSREITEQAFSSAGLKVP